MPDTRSGRAVPVDRRSTDEFVSKTAPVTLASDTFRTVLRLTIPVRAGDLLAIDAFGKVTNEVGRSGGKQYVIGVGWHLWWYNPNLPAGPLRDASWRRIGTSLGENVTPDMHHMALSIGEDFMVPQAWTDGDAMGIALRVAAMSTQFAANGGRDALTIDPCGRLRVERWSYQY